MKEYLKALIVCVTIAWLIPIPANAGCFDCNPQCVTYARERSGIYSCRVGTGGAIDWYNCEKKAGHTSSKPKKGGVLVLKPQDGLPWTGHAIFVEKKEKKDSGKYSLRLSHSNFDCRCSKEKNIKATYYKDKKKVKFKSGAWKDQKLAAAGFIED